jgi:hypothetical protein
MAWRVSKEEPSKPRLDVTRSPTKVSIMQLKTFEPMQDVSCSANINKKF